jgi:hypothetical protein
MFILFFGTRAGKRKEGALPGIECPYCRQTGQLHAVLIRQYVHLFWIPVFRLRPMAFVECAHCKKAYDGGELTPSMQRALEQLKNK